MKFSSTDARNFHTLYDLPNDDINGWVLTASNGRMISDRMSEKSHRRLIWGYITALVWRGWGKNRKNHSVRIAGFHNWTQDLPNKKQGCWPQFYRTLYACNRQPPVRISAVLRTATAVTFHFSQHVKVNPKSALPCRAEPSSNNSCSDC